LTIREKVLGKDHPYMARSLYNLAELYQAQSRYAEAEFLYRRSLAIFEKALGPEHPHVAAICDNIAGLYREIGREDEAERLEARARRIRASR
jgi:tetratricopeptide (TPR) repeat protein